MNDFQILNFVTHSSGSAPTNASGLGGMMWWDSSTYDLKVYNNNDSLWNSLVQGPATTTNTYIPQWSGTIGNKLSTGLQLKTTVGVTGDDTSVVTEQGIREAIASAISGGVNYQGGYNASTNTPDLEAGTGVLKGYMYTVTVAGTFFTDVLAIGDVLIAENDAPTTLAEWTIVAREWNETFLELGDTPSVYTGAGGYMVMVNSSPNALEFINPATYSLSNFNNNLYTASALTKTDDTNVTLTLGGTPASALLQATSLTLGWSGTLAASRGGTGQGTYAIGDLLYASTTSALSRLAAVPAGSFLRSAGSATAPAWSTLTIPNTITEDSILVANAADTLVALQVGNGQSIRLNAGGTAWEAFTPSSGIGNHNLLNGSEHPDTVTQAVSRGSLIYGNSTPLWDELVIGGAGTVLTSNGTDVSWSSNVVLAAGGAIRTSLVATNTLLFQAYDTDGVSYTTFATLTAGTTPTFNLNAATTVGGVGVVAYAGGAFHNGFSDFVANEHINHTSVTITAGSGLSYSTGGTNIASSATIDLDINELTGESAIASTDTIPFYDVTAAANRKITFAQLSTALEATLNTAGYAKIAAGDLGLGASPTITHNFNLTEITDVIVQIWRQSDNKQVAVEITAATLDTVTVSFGAAALNPSIGTFRYIVAAIQE
jgi:hypothetical protein